MSHSLRAVQIADIYERRFRHRDEERHQLWKTLTQQYFQRFVSDDAVVLDLAAGHCEFINNIRCGKKIAVDVNPDTKKHANSDVEVHITSIAELPAELVDQVDTVFVSNFFEHLDTKHDLLETLSSVRELLADGGQILVLQPNIRLAKHAYWDFVDHSLPLTEKSLIEALQLSGYRIEFLRTRFLPYTTHSSLPTNPWLVRLYLRLPPAQWLMGKQSFVIARRR